MAESAIALDGVTKQFGGLCAVDGVSLTVAPGERRVLIGPNGAGKTTLFNCITGTLPASAGQITFFGADVSRMSESQRTALGMGRTFQMSNLFTDLTVRENLMLAVLGRDQRKWTMFRPFSAMSDASQRVRAAITMVELDHRLEHAVSLLSYGERKQLDLALALATEPRALFLDEPCAGLSPSERQQVSRMIKELPEEMTVVMIEHDMDIALGLAQRVSVLHQGRIILEGAPDEVQRNADVREVYFGTA